ncbi:MAG TPA: YicC/YloC family endoribonuclease [Burkholderiaceae bacterium]|nr:YicC/YloC family endoribonuclease [Burkholderiaceae bacterium]
MNSTNAGVRSMTGYGSVSRDHELGRLSVELRSVNSRFLDLSFRLPDELRALEPLMREVLQARLQRGKIDVRAGVQHRSAVRPEVVLRAGALEALRDAQARVLEAFPGAAPMSVADCLRFPGVVDDPQPDPAQWVAAFRPLAEAAVDELVASRTREGARLADGIRERARAMLAVVEVLKPRAPELVAEFGQRLADRLREAATGGLPGTGVPLDEALARIRHEVSVYGMRVDVAEELSRLEIHVAELQRVLDGGGAIGKRLDFLMQELNREANTLGSKAAGLEVTQAAVDLKLLIEQVREQVQNLE